MPAGALPTTPRSAVFWSSLNGAAAVGLPFVVFACFARWMTPGQFAMVGVALAGLEMLKMLAPQGLYDVLVTHDERERAYHESAAAMLLGSTVVVILAFTGLLAASRAVFGMAMPAVMYALGGKAFFDLVLLQPQAAMVRRGEIRRLSTRSLYSGVIGAGVGLPLGALVSPIGGLVAFYVTQSAVTFLATVWGAGALAMPRYHGGAARDMRGQALRASGVRLAAGGNNYLDQLMVGRLFLPTTVGDFNLGKRIEIVSVTIASSLAQILWQPGFARAGAGDRGDAIARAVASVALVCGLPVCLFVILARVAVPFVFGAHWAGAVTVAAVLAASGGARALGAVAGAVLTVTQRNGMLLWVSVIGLGINILIVPVTAPYGIVVTAMAILARAVVLGVIQFAILIEVRREIVGIVVRNCVVPLGLASAACLAARFASDRILAPFTGQVHDFIYLAISCAAGLAVGGPMLLRKI